MEKVVSKVVRDLGKNVSHTDLAFTPVKVKEQPKQPQIVASHPPTDTFKYMSEGMRKSSEGTTDSVFKADRDCQIAGNIDRTNARYETPRKFREHLLPKV